MPKYQWYLVNKDEDVSIYKNVTYKITFKIYTCAHSNQLTYSRSLTFFKKINVDKLSDVRNSVFLNFAIVLDGLHAMVTCRAYSLIWPIWECAAGQSVVRVQNLDTLDTNDPY